MSHPANKLGAVALGIAVIAAGVALVLCWKSILSSGPGSFHHSNPEAVACFVSSIIYWYGSGLLAFKLARFRPGTYAEIVFGPLQLLAVIGYALRFGFWESYFR